jgi:hypothetical protein
MHFVRRSAALLLSAFLLAGSPPAGGADHQHDFDFEFGSWRAHLSRLLHPLSGSHAWVQYDGTSVVRKVWNGKANLGEFDVTGPAGRIHGLSLRLYNPQTHKWNVYWSNAKDGEITTPSVGNFSNGRGLFVDKETFNGRPILSRFVFSKMKARSFQITQSFSPDNGKTWEPNWIATFTR